MKYKSSNKIVLLLKLYYYNFITTYKNFIRLSQLDQNFWLVRPIAYPIWKIFADPAYCRSNPICQLAANRQSDKIGQLAQFRQLDQYFLVYFLYKNIKLQT